MYLTAVSESMFFKNVFLLMGKISCFFVVIVVAGHSEKFQLIWCQYMKPAIFSYRDMEVMLLTMEVRSCLMVFQENETNECAMAGATLHQSVL